MCVCFYIGIHTQRYICTYVYPVYVYIYTTHMYVRTNACGIDNVLLVLVYQGTEALHMATLLTKEEGNLLVFDVPREREDEFRDKLKKLDISSIPFMPFH